MCTARHCSKFRLLGGVCSAGRTIPFILFRPYCFHFCPALPSLPSFTSKAIGRRDEHGRNNELFLPPALQFTTAILPEDLLMIRIRRSSPSSTKYAPDLKRGVVLPQIRTHANLLFRHPQSLFLRTVASLDAPKYTAPRVLLMTHSKIFFAI